MLTLADSLVAGTWRRESLRVSPILGRRDLVKGSHVLKNFIIPRLDLSTLNVVPLMTLVIIYSSVIPRDGLGANGTSASIRNRTTVRGNIATNEGSSLLKTAIGICVVADP